MEHVMVFYAGIVLGGLAALLIWIFKLLVHLAEKKNEHL